MKFLTRCGNKEFYRSEEKGTSHMVWKICCASGLLPASVVSKEEFECLQKYPKKDAVTLNQNKKYCKLTFYCMHKIVIVFIYFFCSN